MIRHHCEAMTHSSDGSKSETARDALNEYFRGLKHKRRYD